MKKTVKDNEFVGFLEAFHVCLREKYDPNNKQKCYDMIDMFVNLLNDFEKMGLFEKKEDPAKAKKDAEEVRSIMNKARMLISLDKMPPGVCTIDPEHKPTYTVDELMDLLENAA